MPTITNSGHAAYAASSAATASPAEVVRMAYGRIVTACDRMTRAAEQKASGWVELFNNESLRAQALLFELTGMLAQDSAEPEVAALADNLASIYQFCERELVTANIAKDPRRCANVRKTIDGLRTAWEQGVCR
jgi:flagellar biosynthetic protein FliS